MSCDTADTDVKWEIIFKLNNVPNTECVISYWSAGYRIDYRKHYYCDTYGKVYDVRNVSQGFLPSISFVYAMLSKLL